jgi:hypothetical protein
MVHVNCMKHEVGPAATLHFKFYILIFTFPLSLHAPGSLVQMKNDENIHGSLPLVSW